jgi:catechol 2,3-dioxygenase
VSGGRRAGTQLRCDVFGDRVKSSAWMRERDEFLSNAMGTFVDAALVARAAQGGASFAKIHERAKAREFSPETAPVDIPYAD